MRPAALKRTKSSVGDYSGTNVLVGAGVRNSWNVWRLLNTPDMLAPKVASFITKHEDALAQEERWRAKMLRRARRLLPTSHLRPAYQPIIIHRHRSGAVCPRVR